VGKRLRQGVRKESNMDMLIQFTYPKVSKLLLVLWVSYYPLNIVAQTTFVFSRESLRITNHCVWRIIMVKYALRLVY
jgi:hypothetical protein